MNVQLRATSIDAPDRSGAGTLVLMPTNHLWSVINSTLNGQAPRDAKAPDVGAKRKTVLKPEGAEHAAPKRVRREASATPEPEPVPSPALLKWQPATWMQANGNAHSDTHAFWGADAEERRLMTQYLESRPFVRVRAGALPSSGSYRELPRTSSTFWSKAKSACDAPVNCWKIRLAC